MHSELIHLQSIDCEDLLVSDHFFRTTLIHTPGDIQVLTKLSVLLLSVSVERGLSYRCNFSKETKILSNIVYT
jgi:hypothetical protein